MESNWKLNHDVFCLSLLWVTLHALGSSRPSKMDSGVEVRRQQRGVNVMKPVWTLDARAALFDFDRRRQAVTPWAHGRQPPSRPALFQKHLSPASRTVAHPGCLLFAMAGLPQPSHLAKLLGR